MSLNIVPPASITFEDSTSPHHKIWLQPRTDWSQELIVAVASLFQRCQCTIILVCYHLPIPPPFIIDALRGNCSIAELSINEVIGAGASREQESCALERC
jgi:hypothetical protein